MTTARLTELGCNSCFREDYSHRFSKDDFTKCDGQHLFVGAKERRSNVFACGAFAPREFVMTSTPLNQPQTYNGVHWYNTPEVSFGYCDSKEDNIVQDPIDRRVTTYVESRLSWNLDSPSGNGGGRAGSSFPRSDDYQKWSMIMYSCPGMSPATQYQLH